MYNDSDYCLVQHRDLVKMVEKDGFHFERHGGDGYGFDLPCDLY